MSRSDWTDLPGAYALSDAAVLPLPAPAEERRWRLMSRLTGVLSEVVDDWPALCLKTAQLVSEELRDGAMVALFDAPGQGLPCMGLACTDPRRVAIANELFTGWAMAPFREMVEDFAFGTAGRVRRGLNITDPASRHAVALAEYQSRVGTVDIALAPLRKPDGTLRGVILNTRYPPKAPPFSDVDLNALAGAADTLSLGLEVAAARAAERTASRRWATVFEVTPVGMLLLDNDGRVLAANRSAAEILRCPSEQVTGRHWTDFADPADQVSDDPCRAVDRAGHDSGVALRRILRTDGTVAWVQRSVARLHDESDRPDGFHLQFADVTSTIAAERAIVDLAEQRRVLLAELVSAEQAERRRIADEVHDDSIQLLAAGQLRLQLVRGHLNNGNLENALRAADGVSDLLASAQAELRRILLDLEDPSAPGHYLDEALRRASEQFFADTRTRVVIAGTFTEIPPEVAAVLYRAGREAVSNARRHADAAHVSIRLHEDESGWHVLVEDDGIGIPLPVPVRPGHLGVRGMTSRVEALGGTCLITAGENGGTRVSLRVPRAQAG